MTSPISSHRPTYLPIRTHHDWIEQALECIEETCFTNVPPAGSRFSLEPIMELLEMNTATRNIKRFEENFNTFVDVLKLRLDANGKLEKPFCPPRAYQLNEEDIRFFLEILLSRRHIDNDELLDTPLPRYQFEFILCCAGLETLLAHKDDVYINTLFSQYRLIGPENAALLISGRATIHARHEGLLFERVDWYEAWKFFENPFFECTESMSAKEFITKLHAFIESKFSHCSDKEKEVIYEINLNFLKTEYEQAPPD